VSVELNVRLIDLGPADSETLCDHCQKPLSLHQPDESIPSQLLATCGSCLRWFSLHEIGVSGSKYIVVELPSTSQVEALVQSKSGLDLS
jgi:hypothetical protein